MSRHGDATAAAVTGVFQSGKMRDAKIAMVFANEVLLVHAMGCGRVLGVQLGAPGMVTLQDLALQYRITLED